MEDVRLVTSAYAAAEADRNIARKRPDAQARLSELLQAVEIATAQVRLHDDRGLPPKDVPILAAAVAARCDVLLTGDVGDFGHLLGNVADGVRVMTPAMWLREHSH